MASDIDANQKKTPMKEIIGHEGLISHFCRHYNSWHSVKIIKNFPSHVHSKTRAEEGTQVRLDANGIIFQGDEIEGKNLALVMSLPFSKEKW